MPILKNMENLNWPSLLAELILVFVGITAALWFDNWSAERDDRRFEKEILVELTAALQADSSDLNGNLQSSERTRASIDTIFAFFDEDRPFDLGLSEHFGLATRFTNFVTNTAAYEQLKSAGLAVITDDGLRRAIVQYYETESHKLHLVETLMVNRHFETDLQPQMIEKFHFRGFLRPATSHDYEQLKGDRVYRSSLATKLGYLDWKDDTTREVLRLAEDILSQIATSAASGNR